MKFGPSSLALASCALIVVLATASAEDPPAVELASPTVAGGESIELKFNFPLDEAQQRYWVCVVPKDSPPGTYGTWAYVDDLSVKSVTLKAPAVDGEYEVRVHSNYPAKSNNILYSLPLKISGLTPTPSEGMRLVLPSNAVPVDSPVKVTFPAALVPEGELKFWVALVPAGAKDDAHGVWRMVPVGATELTLPAATASGPHEVRLHSNYPKVSANVVHRLELKVTGAPDTLATPLAEIKASLAQTSTALGSKARVHFNVPLRPVTGERFWVTIAHADLPDSAQGLTASITPGATSVEAPLAISTGKHRVRLYASPSELVATLELEVTGPADKAPTAHEAIVLSLKASALKAGEAPKADFGLELYPRTGEQFWVTVIEKGKADTEWGAYLYLPIGAKGIELAKPAAAGDYEVRLHANYPSKSSNVIHRVELKVE